MDRYLSITIFFILLNFAGTFVNTWGLGNVQVSSSVNLPTLAGAAGCTTYANGTINCAKSASGFSFSGSSFFQYVLFVGDWIGALVAFVGTFAVGMILPSYWLANPAYGIPAVFIAVVSAGIYVDYFLFVVLFLRGGRVD